MRIPRTELTPTLRREIGSVTSSGGMTGETASRRSQGAIAAYYEARRTDIAVWLLYSIVGVGFVALAIARHKGALDLPLPALWGMVAAYLAAALPLARATPGAKGYTPEEIAAYLPTMELPLPERVLAETLVAAYREGADPSLRTEIVPALRSLCGEGARLDGIEARLAAPGPVGSELEGLRARLAGTEDAVAREALERSIALAEGRAASALSERGAYERVAAHREMIRQSALTIAETVRRAEAPGASETPDLAHLRENVARATGDVAALEAAVREMRAL